MARPPRLTQATPRLRRLRKTDPDPRARIALQEALSSGREAGHGGDIMDSSRFALTLHLVHNFGASAQRRLLSSSRACNPVLSDRCSYTAGVLSAIADHQYESGKAGRGWENLQLVVEW
jgi:hypothetical protein